jgi:multifunctional 2-oxoglutarate metabolism enzyme
VQEVVIGMAHRGRLNVLANVLGKPYKNDLLRVRGAHRHPDGPRLGRREVPPRGDRHAHGPGGATTGLTLAANPSHLEAVNPVVEGMVRAMQDRRRGDRERDDGPAHPHPRRRRVRRAGRRRRDAQPLELDGYRTGGTVHVVVNNQIGFTTLPMHARSSLYATDVARMIQAPIFHVNGDDPEAASAWPAGARVPPGVQQGRRHRHGVLPPHGHNEGDEPSYTQPLMYDKIKGHRSVRKKYTELLLRRGDMDPEAAERMLDDFHQKLQEAFDQTKEGRQA